MSRSSDLPWKTSLCKGCKKPMVWAKLLEGKSHIPLDPQPVVYEITGEVFGKITIEPAPAKFMISHFAVCSGRDLFSNKNKKKLQEAKLKTLEEGSNAESERKINKNLQRENNQSLDAG